MARLIDADAAKELWSGDHPIAIAMRNIFDKLPTVDAVEVVRCWECKFFMEYREPLDFGIGDCKIRKMNSDDEVYCAVFADDYCSYGEKRDANG